MSPVVYLNGVSSAGKSSLARALVEAMAEPYASVSIDAFEGMAQRRWPLPGAQEFFSTCLIPMLHDCAARFADAGLGVVVDTMLLDPAWLRDAAERLGGHEVLFVGVHCQLPELQRRERARGDRQLGKAATQLPRVHAVARAHGGYDLEVDTTATDPEACARQIQRRLIAGPPPAAFRRLRAAER